MASIEPVESSAPKSSRRSSVVSRRETRFLTARVATAACRRGPKAPGGTPAGSAARGPVGDQLSERLDRPQRTTASRRARLGAGPPARSRLTRPRWRRGWILAGGQRGVARVSVEARFKVGKADLKPPVRLAQLGDLSPEQSVLRRELEEHSDDRLTSLLIDRLSLGAFHAHRVRGAEVGACLCALGRLLGGLG